MIRQLAMVLAALILVVTTTSAHTPLKNTIPDDGSTLSESPESISLEFAQAVRLTQLRVELANSADRKLSFTPDGASATFVSSAPNLETGVNKIHWTALSPDGHVIEGSFVVNIQ